MAEKEDGDVGGNRQVFAGVTYRLHGFEGRLDLERKYKTILDKRGAKCTMRIDKATHLIVYSEIINYDDVVCTMARNKYSVVVVNEMWIDDSVTCDRLADCTRVLYWPVKQLAGVPGCLKLYISVHGYPLARRRQIKNMINLMGATFCDEWDEKATHLVSYEFQGVEYKLAKKFKAHVINDKWLEDCLREWKLVPVDKYNRISGSELEMLESQSKVNKQLVSKAETPGRGHAPQSKSFAMDNRKSYSVGSKRSNVQIASENAKCKRALCFGPISSEEISMDEYALGGLTEEVEVPYMSYKRRMAKEGAKLVFLNAYDLLTGLHDEGKSLKGLFNSKTFLVKPNTKKVRLECMEPLMFAKGDDTLDKRRFVLMVEGLFRGDVPEEVKEWLECIEEGYADDLLKKHINMLHANNIFGEFSVMFHIMLELKDLSEDKFEALMEKLSFYDGWETKTFKWTILEGNRQRNNDTKTEPPCQKKTNRHHKGRVFGLMREIRNCWEHPARRYKDFLLTVLLGEYPTLLSDVQQALYEAGCLRHLDIKNLD